MKSYNNDRTRLLAQAADSFQNFLGSLDDYDLLAKKDKEVFKSYLEAPKRFQIAASSDFNERRRLKIERFQAEKGLKSQLEVRHPGLIT